MNSTTMLHGLAIAAVLQLGVLAGSARADMYLYSGSETNVTLDPGTYIITAYGAEGGGSGITSITLALGGLGADLADSDVLFCLKLTSPSGYIRLVVVWIEPRMTWEFGGNGAVLNSTPKFKAEVFFLR